MADTYCIVGWVKVRGDAGVATDGWVVTSARVTDEGQCHDRQSSCKLINPMSGDSQSDTLGPKETVVIKILGVGPLSYIATLQPRTKRLDNIKISVSHWCQMWDVVSNH